MKQEIFFYLRLFLRRLPLFVIVSATIAAGGIAVAVALPTQYRTSAELLVERQQLTLVESTVSNNAAQNIELIRRNMLTRANLLEIAREHDVFEDLRTSPDEIVQKMRENIRISNPRGQAQVVTVSFTGRSPGVVTDVVNELVTRLLAENAETRTGLAEVNTEFFESEVQRLSEELDLQSGRIMEFQSENADAMPSSLGFRLNQQSQLQDRVASAERRISALEERREALVVLFETTGSIVDPNERPSTEAERQLARLQAEYERARLTFSASNPRLSVLRARVEQAEEAVAAERGAVGADSAQQLFELRLSEIDSELNNLKDGIALNEARLETLEASIEATPNNEIQLQALRRDYSNIQSQYNSAVSRLAQAQTGERVELNARGQRITVLESARRPGSPFSPNRPMIAATGVAAGLGVAFVLVAALELLNGSVRRPVELSRSLGITPLATLPYINTARERRAKLFRVLAWLLLFFVLVPAGAFFVHTSVIPLDDAARQIADRILG